MSPRTAKKRRKPPVRARTIDTAAKGRAVRAWELLKEAYPEATCALHHENAFHLLVATILSAQCTDARVNRVTPALFAAMGTPAAMAAAPVETIEEYVRSTGFFRNKAKALKGSAERIATAYAGEVPRTMADLLTLPGVARKTANVVLGTAYGITEGVVVDTHVHRLAQRLGWSSGKTPAKVEEDLMLLFPKDQWILLSHTLIQHGRKTCIARRPRCAECPVSRLCPSSLV